MDKQTGPSGRIGGDFNLDALEAFRNAYAQQLASPNEETVANNSGLPTNTIANTAPWFKHVGASWRYPSGRGPDGDLKQPFDPNAYLSGEVMDGDGEIEEMSDEEVNALLDEVTNEVFDEEDNG
jgi:hypothetical protein